MSEASPSRLTWVGLAILGAALALKIALLATSQSVADGDESIVGLMALHVLRYGEHSVFFQGQAYDVGAGLIAHLAALNFRIAGVSDASLKVAALCGWLLVPVAVWIVVRRHFGARTGLLALALVCFAPTTVEWAAKARGGHMLAAAATVALLGTGLSLLQGQGPRIPTSLLAGGCASLVLWLHPSCLPAVAAAGAGIGFALVHQRRWSDLTALGLSALAIGLLPMLLLPAGGQWSWQHFAGVSVHRDYALLFGSILPGLFTPDLDRSLPPAPFWIRVVGWIWIAAWVIGSVALVRANRDAARGKVLLLVMTATGGAGAMLMVNAAYANPRVLIAAWPLACIVVAVAAGRAAHPRWPVVAALTLVASGIAVHLGSIGPAELHGAGHRQRLPGDIVQRMISDLDAHHVECVFSESSDLQWNIVFETQERIAARWIAPRDRWQRIVDRVNAAHIEGRPCALLLRLTTTDKRLPDIARLAAATRSALTRFTYPYALLYGAPREMIEAQFAREQGWPAPR